MIRRLLRFLLSLFLAVAAILLIIVVVLSLKRDWQRDMLDAVLEARTGMEWSMGEAYFPRPNRFYGTEIFALKDSEGIEFASVDLQLDVGRSLGTGEGVIRAGEIKGLSIDLSRLPPEAFGLTAHQLARGRPDRAETVKAVKNLAEFGLMRVEASGVSLEVNELRVTGTVLLPVRRRLTFDLTIHHVRSSETADIRMEVHAAEFR